MVIFLDCWYTKPFHFLLLNGEICKLLSIVFMVGIVLIKKDRQKFLLSISRSESDSHQIEKISIVNKAYDNFKRSPSKMAENDPQTPPNRFDSFISGAGNGFILGHGLAAAGCVYHSLMNAPRGSKIHDFVTRLPRSVYSSSVQMASWSIISAFVEPLIEPHIEQRWLKNLASGAATGALLECRCGVSGMVTGAYTGAVQSLTMSAFNLAIGSVVRPMQTYRIEKKKKEFSEKRATSVFITPTNALIDAFFHK
ncbi:hypothetical protein TRFO_21656 [Tritrichomonas foetus]|uniref:Uncharacterized protein n=1 Tax=Tritrichomonas foetus TaxID=1144522 RepID=A0A1J4KER3_9EUKA|nr:hypothetical protein TRFO_21656 [Tritrichomonas foetus]|eukprot:OHT09424.1 hypothetical protein TRFO_21656 [Tritrichomonas foetus]